MRHLFPLWPRHRPRLQSDGRLPTPVRLLRRVPLLILTRPLILTPSLLLVGCGSADEGWGPPMEGTTGVECGYRTPVAVSPDGARLVFNHETDGLQVLDVASGERRPPVVEPEARARIEEGRGPDLLTLCWLDQGSEAVLLGSSIPTMDPAQPRIPNIFSLRLDGGSPTLGVRDAAACETRPGRAWDFWTEGRPVAPGSGQPAGFPEYDEPDPVVTRGSRVVQGPDERRARILDADGRTLAQVRPPLLAPLGGRAGIIRFAWSPDGSRLAWVSLQSRLGSWGGQSRVHLREADGSVRTLGPVHRQRAEIVWASDAELLACVREEPGRIVRLLP